MKNSFTLIVLALIMSSCSSQNKIDLAKISFPYNGNKILNKTYDYNIDKVNFGKLKRHYTEDSNLLYFYGISLANEVTPKYTSQNKLDFYVDSNNSTITIFKLDIFTTKESRMLYDILVKNFGAPVYYDNTKNGFFTGVWEKENATYIFKKNNTGTIGNIKTETSNLFIIDNKETENIKHFTNSSYFSSFLEAKEKKRNSNYTYENWVKDEAKDGDDDYLNDFKKNKPLK